MRSLLLLQLASSSALLLQPTTPRALPCHHGRVTPPRCQTSDLPPGWKVVVDEASGKTYYYNSASGETQWQKPIQRFSDRLDDKRALTPGCPWRVKIDLTSPGTSKSVTVTASLRFSEEEGYECAASSRIREKRQAQRP